MLMLWEIGRLCMPVQMLKSIRKKKYTKILYLAFYYQQFDMVAQSKTTKIELKNLKIEFCNMTYLSALMKCFCFRLEHMVYLYFFVNINYLRHLHTLYGPYIYMNAHIVLFNM